MQKADLALEIVGRLRRDQEPLKRLWQSAGQSIHYFVVDDVLPAPLADQIATAFPSPEAMTLKKSLRERKYVSAQMNRHDPLIEDALFAFQAPDVVAVIAQITGKPDLEPDPNLYAGGISLMKAGHYLNPHIDNSHDLDRRQWRNLNLLYYVTPAWYDDHGGHLELWPLGPKGHPITVPSRFNRLVVMETHHHAWHSVSRIRDGVRRCLSNYYFAPTPMRADQPFHVTSFRGRPEQPIRDLVLRLDATLRMGLRWLFPKGVKQIRHRYVR